MAMRFDEQRKIGTCPQQAKATFDGCFAFRQSILASLLLILGSPSLAAESAAYAEKRVGNFNVIAELLPMSEQDVMAKWNTPRTQSFETSLKDEVPVGSPLSAIVLFGGATKKDGKVALHCKTTYLVPGSEPQVAFDGLCFDHELQGPDTDFYFAVGGATQMTVPAFLEGKTLTVEQVVTDKNAGLSVALKTSVKIVSQSSSGS